MFWVSRFYLLKLIVDLFAGSPWLNLEVSANGRNKARFASSTCETKTPSESKKLSMRSSIPLRNASSSSKSVSFSATIESAKSDWLKGSILSKADVVS